MMKKGLQFSGIVRAVVLCMAVLPIIFSGRKTSATEIKKVKVGYVDSTNFTEGASENDHKYGYGYTATQKIREMPDEAKSSLPIIAMTANAFEEDRKKSEDAGMNGHLTKPIVVGELIETLNTILGK